MKLEVTITSIASPLSFYPGGKFTLYGVLLFFFFIFFSCMYVCTVLPVSLSLSPSLPLPFRGLLSILEGPVSAPHTQMLNGWLVGLFGLSTMRLTHIYI